MPLNFHFRGTNLGGWLVLEPWITPSLFYQFLGASEKWGDDAPNKVGFDSFTFCKALGPEEANKQMRRHWKTWVTEHEIKNLAKIGVDTVRIPVGDWMYVPYGPYIGCMDGAVEELDRVLKLLKKHGIKALIDIHAMIGSQNGFDNSGDTGVYEWISTKSTGGAARYRHWEIRGGDWIGKWNGKTLKYDNVNYKNIEHSLTVVRKVIEMYVDNDTVVGIEPVNEPWHPIPIEVLQDEFYYKVYLLVKELAPHWVILFHDSFRLSNELWDDFFEDLDCDLCGLDTHIYQAWHYNPQPTQWFVDNACEEGLRVQALEQSGVPVVVGEWSLATDNCAMWLNGFNDNVPGYPMVECERVECPAPYMGKDQPVGTAFDKTKAAQDPFGTGGESYVIHGTCPRDKPFPADHHEYMKKLGYAKLHAFDVNTHGHFFWNFRTEFEPRWDYQKAVALGWLPSNYNRTVMKQVHAICHTTENWWAYQPAPPSAMGDINANRGYIPRLPSIVDGDSSASSDATTTDSNNGIDIATKGSMADWNIITAVFLMLFMSGGVFWLIKKLRANRLDAQGADKTKYAPLYTSNQFDDFPSTTKTVSAASYQTREQINI